MFFIPLNLTFKTRRSLEDCSIIGILGKIEKFSQNKHSHIVDIGVFAYLRALFFANSEEFGQVSADSERPLSNSLLGNHLYIYIKEKHSMEKALMKISNVLLILAILAFPMAALADQQVRIISVTGSSEKTVKADYAKIHSQLKVISKSMEDSYSQATSKLVDLSQRLQEHGITKEDLVVSVISQGQEYTWRDNAREVVGYYSACSLYVKINSLEDTYRIHETLSKESALTITNTEYGRTDYPTLHNMALKDALKAAETKAEMMAETLGLKPGKAILIREAGTPSVINQPRTLRLAEAESAGASSATTIGNVTIRGDVIVEFEMQ